MPSNRSTIPPSPKVAERLRVLLDYYGTRKSALAAGIGVSPAAVTQWTAGTAAISPVKGKLIAEFFGEDYDFVMGLSDKGSKGLGLVLSDIGADRLQLIASLESGPMDDLKALIDDFLTKNIDEKPTP